MKDLYVFEVVQHSIKRYVGVAPAKGLVRLATTVELKSVQEAQRPIDPKRLAEIAEFVASEGTLSTSIVIGTCNDKLNVTPANITGVPNLYKIRFPETDEEFEEYKNSFDIMDGQHRLFSFLDDYCKLADSDDFEITFEMYIKPTMRERRLVFKNTNEKQEKVPSNLLMWFRAKLEMLNQKEKVYHPVVSLLSSESMSPLKGRIIMGAEPITGGIKAEQLITLLDKANIKTVSGEPLSDERMLLLISNYLSGWEEAVGSKLVDRDSHLGAFSKISGIRFMIMLLPEFYNKAVAERRQLDCSYIKDTINTLTATEGICASDIFDKDSDYFINLGINPFSAETSTVALAKDWGNKLRRLSSGSFDPLA